MDEMRYDCFISVLLYLFNIWDRKELIKYFLFLTYDFHYNNKWETLDDTIICSYHKKDILDRLIFCGIIYEENEIQPKELYNGTLNKDKVITLVIDGFYCSWHPAYHLYHIEHHVIFHKIEKEKIIVIDPFYGNKLFELDDNMRAKKISFMRTEEKIRIELKREIDKKGYIDNIVSFFNDLVNISEQLLKYDKKPEEIQFLRDLKNIICSKKNLLEVIDETDEKFLKGKELVNKWGVLLNRLIYVLLAKKIQSQKLKDLGNDIRKREEEIIRLL